jgi:hypothetical protein
MLEPREAKLLRLALDPAAQKGEIAAAALKLIEAWRSRGLPVEELDRPAKALSPLALRTNPEVLELKKEVEAYKQMAMQARGELQSLKDRIQRSPEPGNYLWPWGQKYKGQMLKEIPEYYLRGQLRWIREDPSRSTKFEDLAHRVEAYLISL